MADTQSDTAHAEITLTGCIRGTSIELNVPTGLADGQAVVVKIAPVAAPHESPRRYEGLLQSCGAWAEAGPELDEWLAEVYAARDIVRPVGDE